MTEEEMQLELEEYARMRRENKAKTVQEVFNLAKAFFEDEEISSIIRDAGLSRNFTDLEQDIINKFAKQIDCPTAFYRPVDRVTGKVIPFESSLSVAMNIAVAAGVVRRIFSGEATNFDDLTVKTLVNQNVTYMNKASNERGPDNRKVAWNDFYRIFCEYLENPQLPDLIKRWVQAYDSGEDYNAAFYAANEPAIQIAWRYGLTLESRFAHLAYLVFEHSVNWKSPTTLKLFLRDQGKGEAKFLEGIDA